MNYNLKLMAERWLYQLSTVSMIFKIRGPKACYLSKTMETLGNIR